ncbi:hypothetical protein ACQX2R_01125 [Corynebacterium diphtheriae]
MFNDLYDGSAMEHKVTIGDKLYLRTKNSGDDWLVYEATDLHAPDKSGLADDASVWGDGPMPGRLLTISCIQPANLLEAAVKNAVVGWQYQGVATADGGSGQETLPEEIDQFAPPADAPTQDPANDPAGAPAEAPAEAPIPAAPVEEAPVQDAPVDAPAVAPVEAPVEVPADQPAPDVAPH